MLLSFNLLIFGLYQYHRLIKDKENTEFIKSWKHIEFAERDTVDVLKDRAIVDEIIDSDDGLEDYINTGRIKIKY